MEDKIERAQRWYMSERGRKFLRELWSIVLGVLIALMLGAVATWIGWKIDVADARRSLSEEIGEISGQARYRVRANDCMEAKFDAIGRILATAERAGRLPPVGPIGEPIMLTWSTGVWNSVISADIGSHLGRDELDNLSGVYEMVGIINARTQGELDAWTRLYAIVGPGRVVATSEVTDLRGTLAQARVINRQIVAASLRLNQTVAAFDLPASKGAIQAYGSAPLRRYCAPIAPPDGRTYGQAPMADVVARISANPITRDSVGISSR